MVRIVPWGLPPVSGGSEGGYTPQPTPEPPAEDYYDFDNIDIKRTASQDHGVQLKSASTAFTANTPTSVTFTKLEMGTLTGVEAINLIGVSSVIIVCTLAPYGDYTAVTDGVLTLSMDPITKALTFVSGSAELTRSSGGSFAYHNLNISQYDCYVYNGNGEIIQTETIEVGE